MDEDVELPPFGADTVEYGFELSRRGDVEGRGNRRVQLLGERLDVRPSLLVQPSDGQLGARGAERLAQP